MSIPDNCGAIKIDKVPHKKRRFETGLPIPPPNPYDSSASLSTKLLTSDIHKISNATISPIETSNVNNAFEHLALLYKLVEEIIDLHEKSCKIVKRVHEIERTKIWKKTNDLESCVLNDYDISSIDEDVSFAESLLDAMLSNGTKLPADTSSHVNKFWLNRTSDQSPNNFTSTFQERRVSYPFATDMWDKVKKTFLTNTASVPTSPNRISSNFFHDTRHMKVYNTAENLNDRLSIRANSDLEYNYRLFHKKLDTKFYRKLAEWEKLRLTSPSLNTKSITSMSDSLMSDKHTDNFSLRSEEIN